MSQRKNFQMFAGYLKFNSEAVLYELDWPFQYLNVCRGVITTLSNIYGGKFFLK